MTSTCTVDCFSQQILLAIGPCVRQLALFAFLLIFANKVCFLLSFFLSIWLVFLADACLGACVVYADLWRKKESEFVPDVSAMCEIYFVFLKVLCTLDIAVASDNLFHKLCKNKTGQFKPHSGHPAVGSQKFNTADHVCNHHQKLSCQHPYLWFLASSGVGKSSAET